MIKTVTVTNNRGEVMTFDLAFPEKSGFAISRIEGVGPVKANVNTMKMATVDGSVFNSARIDERNIVITFIPTGTMGAKEYTGEAGVSYAAGEYYRYNGMMLRCKTSHVAVAGPPDIAKPNSDSRAVSKWEPANYRAMMEESRHLLYRFFPLKKKITLSFKTDTRECSIDGYTESNEPDYFSKSEEIPISIICPDPFFRSDGTGGSTKLDTTLYGLHFPYPDPEDFEQEEDEFVFEDIHEGHEFIVRYDGDAETGMAIHIDISGTVNGTICIENRTTGEIFKLSTNSDVYDSITGSALYEYFVSGDKVFISTYKGNKRVELTRKNVKHNIYNNLAEGSSWVHLVQGDNRFVINLISNGGNPVGFENMSINFEFKLLYEGL